MPEGDTVFRAARLLDRALTGRVLTAQRLPGPPARDRGPVRRHRGRHRLPRQAPAHPGRPGTGCLDAAHPPQDGGHLAGARPRPALATPRAPGPGRPHHRRQGRGGLLARRGRAPRARRRGHGRRSPRPGPARPRLGRRRGRTPPAGRAGPPGARRAAGPAQPRRHRQHVRRRAVLRRWCAPADPGRRRWPTCAGWSCARTRCSTSTRSGRSSPRPGACASASGCGSTAATGRRAGAAAPRSRWRCRARRDGTARRTGARPASRQLTA